MRRSGILLHISSLPSKYGIGTLGVEAYKFVDFLKASGQSLWQILPIGPTGLGDSPYQSASSYAGNPYFIDFDLLVEDGLLKKEDYDSYNWGDYAESVDYGKIYKNRFKVLRIAYERGYLRDYLDIKKFLEKNNSWLINYSLFMAVKGYFNMKAYTTWDMDIRLKKPEAVKRYSKLLKSDIEFHIYIQYLFYKQWNNLKDYANKNNIKILGDIPIYVAEDSVEVWENPKIFMIDERCIPIKVAGCPPDAFTEEGQLWGNPVYSWDELKKQNYRWWIQRINAASTIYDIVRIDHFRGFSSFYAIPFGDKNSKNGQWVKAPGIELFNQVKKEIPEVNIIAEDLGHLTEDVYELMSKVGFPGMKVLLFGFENNGDSEYIPYKINENSVSYIGTHDNDTFIGWMKEAAVEQVDLAEKYMNLTCEEGYNWGAIRTLYGTKSRTTIVQMQDILGLDNSARMNLPGSFGGNWTWRLGKDKCSKSIEKKLYDMTKIFGRLNFESHISK